MPYKPDPESVSGECASFGSSKVDSRGQLIPEADLWRLVSFAGLNPPAAAPAQLYSYNFDLDGLWIPRWISYEYNCGGGAGARVPDLQIIANGVRMTGTTMAAGSSPTGAQFGVVMFVEDIPVLDSQRSLNALTGPQIWSTWFAPCLIQAGTVIEIRVSQKLPGDNAGTGRMLLRNARIPG